MIGCRIIFCLSFHPWSRYQTTNFRTRPGRQNDSKLSFCNYYYMTDPRYRDLAELLVRYSTDIKKDETVLLDMIDVPDEFTVVLARTVRDAGAIPLIETRHTRVTRELLQGMT